MTDNCASQHIKRSTPGNPRKIALKLLAPALAAVVGSFFIWELHGGASDAQPAIVPPMPAAGGLPAQAQWGAFKFTGVSSCAAASCHGAADVSKPLRSASSIWAQKDKHSRAYDTLFDERSKTMVKLLAGGSVPTPAHEQRLCLTCHAMSSLTPEKRTEMGRFNIEDGVGCEACHGPAEKWLGLHSQSDWRERVGSRGERKAKLGMTNTKHDLRVRGAICIDCHVGSEQAEVNHDLIAAGHPRLSFELSAYLELMPPHWRQTRNDENSAGFSPAQTWAVGQALSAEAALEQLDRRAKTRESAWPEFAEYDCFACHHDLTHWSWRQEPERGSATQRSGLAAWGTWYFPKLVALVGEFDPAAGKELEAALARLNAELSKPLPDRKSVTQIVSELRGALQRGSEAILRADQSRFAAKQMPDLIHRLAYPVGDAEIGNWDQAAQAYLALVPLVQTYDEGGGFQNDAARRSQIRDALSAVAAGLSYEPGKSSPSDANWRSRTSELDQLKRIKELIQR